MGGRLQVGRSLMFSPFLFTLRRFRKCSYGLICQWPPRAEPTLLRIPEDLRAATRRSQLRRLRPAVAASSGTVTEVFIAISLSISFSGAVGAWKWYDCLGSLNGGSASSSLSFEE